MPTTTTTTTTLSPLSVVQTYSYNEQTVLTQTSNASDSTNNLNTPLAKSFNFGSIAPGGTSQTIVVALNVPNTKAIDNIRIALMDTGGLTFTTSTFGYSTSVELKDSITPEYYFQGINSSKSSTSPYNVSIKNRDYFNSEYVYLNIHMPSHNAIRVGVIKLCWFFDYAD